jgi:hypothetical protein
MGRVEDLHLIALPGGGQRVVLCVANTFPAALVMDGDLVVSTDKLNPAGVECSEPPATSARIWAAFHTAKSGSPYI